MWVGTGTGVQDTCKLNETLTSLLSCIDDIVAPPPTPDEPLVGWVMCAMCVFRRAPRKVGSMLYIAIIIFLLHARMCSRGRVFCLFVAFFGCVSTFFSPVQSSQVFSSLHLVQER